MRLSRLLGLAVLMLIAVGLATSVPAAASDYDEALAAITDELSTCIKAGDRQRVAAVDFTDLQMNVSELGRLIAEELSTELVRQAGGEFAIIDRNHLQIILQEHELSANGLVNPENAKKLGQFAGVDTLITGNVFELEESIRVTAKAMDTESATIVCASRGDLPKTMMLREIAGIAAGRRTTGDSTTPATPEPPVADDEQPEYRDSLLRATIDSATKTRDGARVQLVISLQNVGSQDFFIALNKDDPPTLSDNIGSDWRFVRCSGIDTKVPDHGIYVDGSPKTRFNVGNRVRITCTFSGSGSPGTTFDLTASLLARSVRAGFPPRNPSLVSLSVVGIRIR